MVYTNSKATLKWWDPHTKRLKYCPSINFDVHNSNLNKGWSPGSEIMLGTNNFTLTTLKIDLSDHSFIKNDIFKAIIIIHQEGIPLASPHNTVNIITRHKHLNQKITSHGIMNFQIERGKMFGSSALTENNQHQHNNFWMQSQVRNS